MPFYSPNNLRNAASPLWLLSNEQARAHEASAQAGLAPHTLMSRAGEAVARLVLAKFPYAQHVTVLCGPGNNGGDGFVAAAWLTKRGITVSVFANETKAQDAAWARRLCPDIHSLSSAELNIALRKTDVVIDALFGASLTRALNVLDSEWAAIIERMNSCGKPILAVDMPSGLHSDTGNAMGKAVQAHTTLALLSLRPGHFTGEAAAYVGELWWHDLDILYSYSSRNKELISENSIILPIVSSISHKGNRGTVAVIGGALGMRGAPLLGARAALACGAGRVHVGFLAQGSEPTPALDAQEPSLMCHHIDKPDVKFDADTIVFGPGAGSSELSQATLHGLLKNSADKKLVIDADGLNLLAQHESLRKALCARAKHAPLAVLTPHPLEAARLLNCTTAEVQNDRVLVARELAVRYQSVVLLKGAGTVISQPDGKAAISPAANARLATAGSGDVLAGVIGALFAQGLSAWDATYTAIYMQACGNIISENYNILPIVASQQVNLYAQALAKLSLKRTKS